MHHPPEVIPMVGLNGFSWESTLGMHDLIAAHFEIVLIRLVVASVLGASVAYRWWRRLMPNALPPARESAQAQTLIAVAGALMVAVIGDSMARAFGLVGLGAFIRFRSGIKDPRDAAVMFVMIGIGMACGLGAVPIAMVATLFVTAVLVVFDAGQRARARMARIAISVDEPRAAFAQIRSVFPTARIVEMPNTNPEPGRLVMDVVLGEATDAAAVLEILQARDGDGHPQRESRRGQGGLAASNAEGMEAAHGWLGVLEAKAGDLWGAGGRAGAGSAARAAAARRRPCNGERRRQRIRRRGAGDQRPLRTAGRRGQLDLSRQ